MKRLFEFRVFDIMKDDDNREFLNRVKDENLDKYDRFMSLVGNKGLEIAKQKYFQYDPIEIKRIAKEKKDTTRKEQNILRKQRDHEYLMSVYGDVLKEITEYLKTSPLKGILNIIKQEKNLKNWKKQYKTGDLKLGDSRISSFNEARPIDTVVLTPRIYKSSYINEFREDTFTIYQYVSLSRDRKSVRNYYFSIKFDFDFNFFVNTDSEFEEDKFAKIYKLRRTNMDIEQLKEVLEEFKYYMSDKFEEDCKIEKEVERYNL